MAVVIRLARCGSKHKPKYRLMVADSRRYVTGKYLDNLGYYIPKVGVQQESIHIDLAKINDWIKKGAKPTARVQYLMKQTQK
jgi:small subunit ribosomal protein S16